MIAGIDPGKTGAVSLLNSTGKLFGVKGVPLVGTAVNYPLWAAEWQAYLRDATHVYIEQVAARPGQGVTSMFNFGTSYGFVLGLVAGIGVPHTLITPQKWRKVAGCVKSGDKNDSRLRASMLFPEHADKFSRVKDDGKAEAALIAYAGYLIQKGL